MLVTHNDIARGDTVPMRVEMEHLNNGQHEDDGEDDVAGLAQRRRRRGIGPRAEGAARHQEAHGHEEEHPRDFD